MAIIYYISFIILGLTNEINKLSILLDSTEFIYGVAFFCQGEDNPHKICAIVFHFIYMYIFSFTCTADF